MKKKLTLLLCLVLTLVMTFAMVGCVEKDDDDDDRKPKKEKVTVVGEWEAEVDMMDLLMDEFGEEMADYIDMDEFILTMYLELDDDDNYKVSMDKDAFEDQLVEMLESMMTNMMQEAADEAGVTLDELLEAAGMTMDELIETTIEEADMDSLMADFEDEEGTYEWDDDKLTFDDGDTEWTIELDGDTFEITDMDGEDAEMVDLLPIVFTRK